MAEIQKKTKRLVKNPETFREKALKATEASDKPKRSRKLRQAGSKIARPIFGPIGRLLGNIFNRKPFQILGRILLPRYFRNSWRELRLVAWPSRKQSRDLTYAVLAFAIVFGGVVAVVDYGLDKLFRGILLK